METQGMYNCGMPKTKAERKVAHNFRLPIGTMLKIVELQSLYGSQAEVIVIAVDRMYREEAKPGSVPSPVSQATDTNPA